MRFKIDENLPVEIAELLREHGHDALTIFDQQMTGAPDPNVANVCVGEQRAPLTLEDARRVVDEFVQTYNEKRLHSGIGYVTPADMLAERAKEIHEARDRKLAEARDRRRAARQNARAAVGASYTDSAQSEDKALPGGNLSAELGPKSEGMAVAP